MKIREISGALSAFVTIAGSFHAAVLPAVAAETGQNSALESSLSYADLVDLADPAGSIAKVRIRKQATLEPERSPGLKKGHVRLYIVARVEESLRGNLPVGESIRYLADVPFDAKGKAPRLKGRDMIAFAHTASAKPGDLQLIAPDAHIPAAEPVEARLRAILTELAAPDRPPRVKGIRDILAVPGNLVGESETQVFLTTEEDSTALVSVVRRPDNAPAWGVSWDELVDGAGGPPARDTLAWYRLACFLPPAIPRGANLGSSPDVRGLAAEDYRLVLRALGECPRSRKSGG